MSMGTTKEPANNNDEFKNHLNPISREIVLISDAEEIDRRLDFQIVTTSETQSRCNAMPNVNNDQDLPKECSSQQFEAIKLTHGDNSAAKTLENVVKSEYTVRRKVMERTYMLVDKTSGSFQTEKSDDFELSSSFNSKSDFKEFEENFSDCNGNFENSKPLDEPNGSGSEFCNEMSPRFASEGEGDSSFDGLPVVYFGSQQAIVDLYQGTLPKSAGLKTSCSSFESQIEIDMQGFIQQSEHSKQQDSTRDKTPEELFPFFEDLNDSSDSLNDFEDELFDFVIDSNENDSASWSDTPFVERPLLSEDDCQPSLQRTVLVTDLDALLMEQHVQHEETNEIHDEIAREKQNEKDEDKTGIEVDIERGNWTENDVEAGKDNTKEQQQQHAQHEEIEKVYDELARVKENENVKEEDQTGIEIEIERGDWNETELETGKQSTEEKQTQQQEREEETGIENAELELENKEEKRNEENEQEGIENFSFELDLTPRNTEGTSSTDRSFHSVEEEIVETQSPRELVNVHDLFMKGDANEDTVITVQPNRYNPTVQHKNLELFQNFPVTEDDVTAAQVPDVNTTDENVWNFLDINNEQTAASPSELKLSNDERSNQSNDKMDTAPNRDNFEHFTEFTTRNIMNGQHMVNYCNANDDGLDNSDSSGVNESHQRDIYSDRDDREIVVSCMVQDRSGGVNGYSESVVVGSNYGGDNNNDVVVDIDGGGGIVVNNNNDGIVVNNNDGDDDGVVVSNNNGDGDNDDVDNDDGGGGGGGVNNNNDGGGIVVNNNDDGGVGYGIGGGEKDGNNGGIGRSNLVYFSGGGGGGTTCNDKSNEDCEFGSTDVVVYPEIIVHALQMPDAGCSGVADQEVKKLISSKDDNESDVHCKGPVHNNTDKDDDDDNVDDGNNNDDDDGNNGDGNINNGDDADSDANDDDGGDNSANISNGNVIKEQKHENHSTSTSAAEEKQPYDHPQKMAQTTDDDDDGGGNDGDDDDDSQANKDDDTSNTKVASPKGNNCDVIIIIDSADPNDDNDHDVFTDKKEVSGSNSKPTTATSESAETTDHSLTAGKSTKRNRKSLGSDSEHLRNLKNSNFADQSLKKHTSNLQSKENRDSTEESLDQLSGSNRKSRRELSLDERILNVNRSIDWVRRVIMEMRAQDFTLKLQFDGIRQEIRTLKQEYEQYGFNCEYYDDEELQKLEHQHHKPDRHKSHVKTITAIREDSGYHSDASSVSDTAKDDGKLKAANVTKAKYLYQPIPAFPKVQTLSSGKCVFEIVL